MTADSLATFVFALASRGPSGYSPAQRRGTSLKRRAAVSPGIACRFATLEENRHAERVQRVCDEGKRPGPGRRFYYRRGVREDRYVPGFGHHYAADRTHTRQGRFLEPVPEPVGKIVFVVGRS